MTTVDALVKLALDLRVAWMRERPRPAARDSLEEMLEDCRAEFRYHRDVRDQIDTVRRAAASIVEDCEIAMADAEEMANTIKGHIDAQRDELPQHPDAAPGSTPPAGG